ncbi:hypothetical protein PMAYCL1PPCAC_02429, partial [Pristionchus mayeri]
THSKYVVDHNDPVEAQKMIEPKNTSIEILTHTTESEASTLTTELPVHSSTIESSSSHEPQTTSVEPLLSTSQSFTPITNDQYSTTIDQFASYSPIFSSSSISGIKSSPSTGSTTTFIRRTSTTHTHSSTTTLPISSSHPSTLPSTISTDPPTTTGVPSVSLSSSIVFILVSLFFF